HRGFRATVYFAPPVRAVRRQLTPRQEHGHRYLRTSVAEPDNSPVSSMTPASSKQRRHLTLAAAPSAWLPTTRQEMLSRGWNEIDILIISGDAYVDHPAFGPVLIARFLEARGYRVGFIAQPDWRNVESLKVMGTPR